MSFFILFGNRDFNSEYQVKDPTVLNDDHSLYYCPNCHNFSVRPINRKEFLTIWFIPLIPFYWGKQLHCSICNWRQDFSTEEQLRKIKNENSHMKTGHM